MKNIRTEKIIIVIPVVKNGYVRTAGIRKGRNTIRCVGSVISQPEIIVSEILRGFHKFESLKKNYNIFNIING